MRAKSGCGPTGIWALLAIVEHIRWKMYEEW